jgi:hypothetical protein
MSINGVGGPYGTIRPNVPGAARTEATSAQRSGTAQRAIAPAAPVAPKGAVGLPATQALPATPPQGTDPALWSVLTQDERSYFAKLGAMGPLTYGRVLSGQMAPATPNVRGGRLDVKA